MESFRVGINNYTTYTPHSLGKLIEWKVQLAHSLACHSKAPHSLGKLIEWKAQ